jgi:hypothetical protein
MTGRDPRVPRTLVDHEFFILGFNHQEPRGSEPSDKRSVIHIVVDDEDGPSLRSALHLRSISLKASHVLFLCSW